MMNEQNHNIDTLIGGQRLGGTTSWQGLEDCHDFIISARESPAHHQLASRYTL